MQHSVTFLASTQMILGLTAFGEGESERSSEETDERGFDGVDREELLELAYEYQAEAKESWISSWAEQQEANPTTDDTEEPELPDVEIIRIRQVYEDARVTVECLEEAGFSGYASMQGEAFTLTTGHGDPAFYEAW